MGPDFTAHASSVFCLSQLPTICRTCISHFLLSTQIVSSRFFFVCSIAHRIFVRYTVLKTIRRLNRTHCCKYRLCKLTPTFIASPTGLFNARIAYPIFLEVGKNQRAYERRKVSTGWIEGAKGLQQFIHLQLHRSSSTHLILCKVFILLR